MQRFLSFRPSGGPARLCQALLLTVLCTGMLLAQGITTKRNYIRVDQFGYLPNAKKVAVIADAVNGFNSAYGVNLDVGQNIQLRRASDNAVVKQSKATPWNGGNTDDYSGDRGWWWDFSDYATAGTYYIQVTEVGGNTVNSNRFDINSNVYDVVLKKAVNMFYYQRCDTDKNGNFASGSNWTDGKWYTQDANTRYLYDNNTTKDMRGGWIDAGDPNKYITFAAPAVHNLLTSYETHPGLWNDFNLDLPESGNSAPDILDEVKFEMDWIGRMQAANGGVHIKMGILDDSGYRNPPSGDNRTRYYEEVCPSASVVAAGMMAHAAAAFNRAGAFSGYSNDLRTRAENAWNYYENSGDKDKECDEGRIEAGDADGDYAREHLAEATVAAVYLYQLTGKAKYDNFVKNNYRQCRPYKVGTGTSEWAEYRAHQGEALINYTKLSNADGNTKSAILDLKKSAAKSSGPYYSVQTNQNLYRARAYFLNWGSNSLMSRNGSDNMDFINLGINTGNHGKHRERAQSIVNYIHGVNPFGMTYLSNMYGEGAELCADEMWHTWFTDGSQYDGTHSGRVGPPPGFLSGGAQSQGAYLPMRVGNIDFNTGTTDQPGQKQWSSENGYAADRQPWAFNEPAIYYQASYVKLLADVIADGGGGATPPPPPPPPPTTASNTWVYRDALNSGWNDWSWGGTVTAQDGGVRQNGSSSFKYQSGGGSASMRHTNGFTTTDLNSVRFWARSWDTNYTSQVQARWNDEEGKPGKPVSVTPAWKEFTIGRDELATGWIKRLVWSVPNGRTIFLDDVRLVYNTSARGTLEQGVRQVTAADVSQPTLTLFPNPTDGAFTLDLELIDAAPKLGITLFDLTGRIVDQVEISAVAGHNRLRMDYRKSSLPTGIYLIEVATPTGETRLLQRVSIK